jgi:PPOX class probable F420-dependent enzyme
MPPEPLLSATQRTFLESARRAVLATIAPDGRPRLVPICFVVLGEAPILYTPIDDKPKRSDDPLALARVRDIEADPRVTILVDRWDEDWSRLAWLRGEGRASLLEPSNAHAERAQAVMALRAKYLQYTNHRLEERPLIRIDLERVVAWGPPDAPMGSGSV